MKAKCLAVLAVILLLGAGGARSASTDDLAQRLSSTDEAVSSGALRELPALRQADRQALAVKLAAQVRVRSKVDNWADHVQNTNIERALAELGSDAAAAVPALVAAIDYAFNTDGGDDDPRDDYYGGFAALARIGAPAVPALRDMLKIQGMSKDAEGVLGGIGPAAREAIPDLYALLAATSDAGTAAAIIRIGLDGLTKEQRALVFKAAIPAAELDGPIGEAFHKFSSEALPVVQGVLNSGAALPLYQRSQAMVALGATGLATAPDAEKVLELLRSTNPNDVTLAYKILTRLGPNARSVLPEIEKLIIYEAQILYKKKSFVNERALALADAIDPAALDSWLAGQIADGENCAALTLAAGRGPKFRGAAMQLAKQALKDQCGGVQDVIPVLVKMEGDGAKALAFMLRRSDRPSWRWDSNQLCDALAGMGQQAAPVLMDLVVAVRLRKAGGYHSYTPDGHMVDSCLEALHAVGTPAAREAAKGFEAGEKDGEIAAYTKAIETDPENAKALVARGLVYARNGRYYTAIADYSRAIELDPAAAGAFYARARANVRYGGNYAKAIEDYSRTIELDPDNAEAFEGLAAAHNENKDPDKAIECYSRIIAINPENTRAYHYRGLTYAWKGEYDKAIENYSKVIELDPKLEAAYHDRGIAWSWKGDQDKAMEDYSKAIELNPKYAAAYASRGLLYEKKGRPKEAEEDCASSMGLDPSPANPCNNLEASRKARENRVRDQKALLEKIKARRARP